MNTWRGRACTGSMTYFWKLRTKGFTGTSFLPPSSTMPCEWAIRVVIRTITGRSYCSEISKASFTKSLHSAGFDGSIIGTFAARARCRLSCSFCELHALGSSALMITNPPFTPV